MKPFPCLALLALGLAHWGFSAEPVPGTRLIESHGYSDCIELSNGHTRVVLGPALGGRVLAYQLDGNESIQQDRAQDGLLWSPGKKIGEPSGGRCGIGPEARGEPIQPIWLGLWTAEITGPRTARMTSPVTERGIQVVRDFTLAPDSSHLRFTQIIRNHGSSVLRTFHWSRTFAQGNGIALAPLPARSRFPSGYVLSLPGRLLALKPDPEPNVRIREGLLEIIGPPTHAKFSFDVSPGWLGYLTRSNLFFLKKFAVFTDRVYGEPTASNASFWYNGERMTEIEPIGPLEVIAPGAEARFTEDWWLHAFPFPKDRTANLAKVRALVDASTAE